MFFANLRLFASSGHEDACRFGRRPKFEAEIELPGQVVAAIGRGVEVLNVSRVRVDAVISATTS